LVKANGYNGRSAANAEEYLFQGANNFHFYVGRCLQLIDKYHLS